MDRFASFGILCVMAICGVVLMYSLPDYWTNYLPTFSETVMDVPPYPKASSISTDTIFRPTTLTPKLTLNEPSETEITIAIGCAITSGKLEKKMNFQRSTANEIKMFFPVFRNMAPSFCKTASAGYSYHFFFAYDSVDAFFKSTTNRDLFLSVLNDTIRDICEPRGVKVTAHTLTCDHTRKPAWAQNDAMLEAYLHNMDYFYRINDDSVLTSNGWTEIFIKTLKAYDPPNVGVVGPHHQGGNTGILTYDFVHKTHIDMFGFYYPRAFTDWYADNWITNSYKPGRSTKVKEVHLKHTMELGRRYPLQGGSGALKGETAKAKYVMLRYIMALKENNKIAPTPNPKLKIIMSIFGNDTDMLFGAIRNAQLAQVVYPSWTLSFYVCASPCPNTSLEVPEIYLEKLRHLGALIVPIQEDYKLLPPKFWDYQVINDDSTDIFLVRNSKNRFTERERSAVNEWLKSDWLAHSIFDLDLVKEDLLVEGLWGMKMTSNPQKDKLRSSFLDPQEVVKKQKILDEVVYPIVKDTVLCHTHINCSESGTNYIVLPQDIPMSDGLIGQPYTWNMVAVKPVEKALQTCATF